MPGSKTTAKKSAPKKAKKVTIDDVWATIDRIGKAQEEIQQVHKETEQGLKELKQAHEETEKSLRETTQTLNKAIDESEQGLKETREALYKTIAETNKAIGETNKAVNGLSSTFGSLVEHVMTPDLPRKFRQFGFNFNRVTTIKWAVEGSIYTEIDGLLENGSQAMVVEVKTTLHQEDIDEHLERMDKVRAYSDEHGDKREFLGAMAAMITSESTRKYALKKGFFVIEPSGEDVKITPPVSEPRRW